MPPNIRQTKPSAILLLNDLDNSSAIKRIIEEKGISVIVTNDPEYHDSAMPVISSKARCCR